MNTKTLISIFTILLFCVCSILCLLYTSALASTDAEYTIVRTSVPPKIDGNLNDVVWKFVEPAELALTNQGGKATKKSLAYAVYDNTYLYFAFHRLDKDINKLKADAAGRDGSVWEDDEFELFLDANYDQATYWQLCINSENGLFDCYNSGGGCDVAEDTDWDTATKLGEKEDWFAEVRVSFKNLDVKEVPKDRDVWGLNFCGRVMSGVDEWVTWADIGAAFHVPTGFGTMIFSKEVRTIDCLDKLPVVWGQVKNQ